MKKVKTIKESAPKVKAEVKTEIPLYDKAKRRNELVDLLWGNQEKKSKNEIKISSEEGFTPVKLEDDDEKDFIISYLQSKAKDGIITKKIASKKIAYLNKAISKYPLNLQLEELEIEALCVYWATGYFQSGDEQDEYLRKRLKYLSKLTNDGDKIIKQTFAGLYADWIIRDEEDGYIGSYSAYFKPPIEWYDSNWKQFNKQRLELINSKEIHITKYMEDNWIGYFFILAIKQYRSKNENKN